MKGKQRILRRLLAITLSLTMVLGMVIQDSVLQTQMEHQQILVDGVVAVISGYPTTLPAPVRYLSRQMVITPLHWDVQTWLETAVNMDKQMNLPLIRLYRK